MRETPKRRKRHRTRRIKRSVHSDSQVSSTHNTQNVNKNSDVDFEENKNDAIDSEGRKGHIYVKIALLTNSTLIAVQLVMTVLTGSLLLFSDTIDGLIDSFSLAIPLLSVYVAKRCDTDHGEPCKLETVSNNTFKLLSLSLMLSYRFVIILNCIIEFLQTPELAKPLLLVGVGAAGFVLNMLTAGCVMKQNQHSHDHEEGELLLATIWHVFSDAIGSFLVLGVGLFFYFSDDRETSRYIDLGLTIFVSLVMMTIAGRMLVKDVSMKIKYH